jgi:pimeloyl-ACP methyl ester carboxylesterase
VNGLLWDGAAAGLLPGHRCILPDWPMGSHPEAMSPGADVSPRGMAATIAEFLAELGLEDVTLVGNDSGGAVCQLLVTERPAGAERVGRLVLTNCDCFEKFPPGHFKLMGRALRVPGVPALFAHSMRLRMNRRSPLSYGALTERPIADALLRAWTEPQIHDRGVRRDGVAFFSAADPRDTLAAADLLPELRIPALLVWGTGDSFFTIEDGRRLADLIPDSKLVEVPGAKTFLPLDRPEELATEVAGFIGAAVGSPA